MCDNTNILSVAEFYKNKNIFVTGGSGFLGTVLLEALLSTSPDIGKIYVLIREKNGRSALERIKRLIEKPLFLKHNDESLAKIIPVIGELTDEKFGLTDEAYEELTEKVNIIFHSAATIRIFSYLETAITINLTGTLRTIELAKSLKNFTSYIYFSTSFCNTNILDEKILEEKIYASKYDPYDLIRKAKDKFEFPRDGIALKEFLKGFPNAYTLSKQLAEYLISKELKDYAAGIVRPSIVYGTYEHPVRGWLGSANSGHLGFLIGYYKGLFRSMCSDPNSILDIIPCDYVVNSSLVLAYHCSVNKVKDVEVIHCTSGEVNQLTNQEFVDILNNKVRKHPGDIMLWKPYTKIRNPWRHKIFVLCFHYIPAFVVSGPQMILPIRKPRNSAISYVKVFDNGIRAFNYFVQRNFRYSLKNSLKILSGLSEEDRRRYNYDATLCNWNLFLENCIIGLRKFVFKESATTSTYHKFIWILFETLHYFGLLGLFIGICLCAYMCVGPQLGVLIGTMIFLFLMWL